MLFKQVQCFTFNPSLPAAVSSLLPKMQALLFRACAPSFASSHGWVAPISAENASLVYSIDHYWLFKLQFEEKVLPSGVINKELDQKIKELQAKENRKIYSKEKKNLRDDITMTLLPRAFTQISVVHACVDIKHNRLILDTLQAEKTKAVLSAFKKCFEVEATPLKLKKIPYLLTQWVKNNAAPEGITILDTCCLQDPGTVKRRVRSQAQSVFAPPLQALIDSGLEVTQLLLNWQEVLNFTLTEHLHLKNLRYSDEALTAIAEESADSALHRFHTDFILMIKTLDKLLEILIQHFVEML